MKNEGGGRKVGGVGGKQNHDQMIKFSSAFPLPLSVLRPPSSVLPILLNMSLMDTLSAAAAAVGRNWNNQTAKNAAVF